MNSTNERCEIKRSIQLIKHDEQSEINALSVTDETKNNNKKVNI